MIILKVILKLTNLLINKENTLHKILITEINEDFVGTTVTTYRPEELLEDWMFEDKSVVGVKVINLKR